MANNLEIQENTGDEQQQQQQQQEEEQEAFDYIEAAEIPKLTELRADQRLFLNEVIARGFANDASRPCGHKGNSWDSLIVLNSLGSRPRGILSDDVPEVALTTEQVCFLIGAGYHAISEEFAIYFNHYFQIEDCYSAAHLRAYLRCVRSDLSSPRARAEQAELEHLREAIIVPKENLVEKEEGFVKRQLKRMCLN
jgi:hypothetical protein